MIIQKTTITATVFNETVKLAKQNAMNNVLQPAKRTPYVMIKGIPHKMVNKQLVPLTKLVK